MNNQMNKGNKKLIILIVILCFIILLLGGYIIYNKVNNHTNSKTVNVNESNSITENNNKNSNNEKIIENNKIDEKDFIRNTEVILVEEPMCHGNSSDTSLIATIEPDGNISIAQNGGAAIIEVGNAKYLYNVAIMACDIVKLYYITAENELYVVNDPKSNVLDQKSTKVTENKIVEFLGTENINDTDYLKLLKYNNEIEYIDYHN